MNRPADGPVAMNDSPLTHFDRAGQAHMVDVAAKSETARRAIAHGRIVMQPATLALIAEGRAGKGDVLAVARLAGILAAKRTGELIPLCHPLALEKIGVDIAINEAREVVITCTARLSGKTGVEMEALTGASVAALTIYDMCKAFTHDIVIKSTRLLEKTGGKSDYQSA